METVAEMIAVRSVEVLAIPSVLSPEAAEVGGSFCLVEGGTNNEITGCF